MFGWHHEKTTRRPWGWFTTLYETPALVVKELTIQPGQRISLQKHRYIDETWRLVKGAGVATIRKEKILFAGDGKRELKIPHGVVHRVEAMHWPLVFVEVRTGVKNYAVEESDCIRLQDDYGRVKK